MKRPSRYVLLCGLTALFIGHATAQTPRFSYYLGGNQLSQQVATGPAAPPSTYTFNVGVLDPQYNIYVSNNVTASAGTGKIILSGTSAASEYKVYIGAGTYNASPLFLPSNPGTREFWGFDVSDPSTLSKTRMAGWIGDRLLGDIRVGTLDYLFVGEDILANIEFGGSTSGTEIFAEGISSNAIIHCVSGDIERLDLTGSLLGTVEIDDGRFDLLPNIDGAFSGIIRVAEDMGSIDVNSSNITPAGEGLIIIGTEMGITGSGGGTLRFRGNEGLNCQIIVNADNGPPDFSGSYEDYFRSNVTVDAAGVDVTGSTLYQSSPFPERDGPYYHMLSEQLGGSIGVAPFNFHQRDTAPPTGVSRDCDPYHRELIAIPLGGSLDEATISHYGPVFVDTANETEPYFRVEYKLPGKPWTDRTSLFEVDLTQTGTSEATAQRNVVIKKKSTNPNGFVAVGQWRIRPYADKVRCAYVTGNPDVHYVSDEYGRDAGTSSGAPEYYWYTFDIQMMTSGSGGLLVANNTVAMSDLQAWSDEPYEVNADGSTNSADLSDLIQALDD